MNYIIENNVNFYDELNKELLEESINDNICLLTHVPLEQNPITLECNHKFNYIPLYNEVCNQKKDSYLETTHLLLNQIKCPYCRSITNKLLPYVKHKDVTYKRGVNYPLKYGMKLYSCKWMKYGKNKQELCNKAAYISDHGIFCSTHQNMCNKKIQQENKTKKIELNWTPEHERINKKYKVTELRQLLRDNKKKYKFIISGNKKELIHRIISWGLIFEVEEVGETPIPPTNQVMDVGDGETPTTTTQVEDITQITSS